MRSVQETGNHTLRSQTRACLQNVSKSVSTDGKISENAASVSRSNRWPSDGIRSLKGVLELEFLPAQAPKIALPASELVAYEYEYISIISAQGA